MKKVLLAALLVFATAFVSDRILAAQPQRPMVLFGPEIFGDAVRAEVLRMAEKERAGMAEKERGKIIKLTIPFTVRFFHGTPAPTPGAELKPIPEPTKDPHQRQKHFPTQMSDPTTWPCWALCTGSEYPCWSNCVDVPGVE